jgi:hypothetical protein
MVTLKGLDKLDDILIGYQEMVIKHATRPSAAEILIAE